MTSDWLRGILVRDLGGLRRALEVYPAEGDIWKTVPGITNSGGTLALHLVGNIRAFIGAQLGHSGFVRDRDAEFGRRGVPRAELLALVDEAIAAVKKTLPKVTEADLEQPYPMAIGGYTITTGDFLLHLVSHLGYHLGQIDYHRRIVTGDGTTIGAVPPAELSTAHKAG